MDNTPWHRDWLDDDNDDDEPGLEFADLDIMKKWVVKLEFKKHGEVREGTGFLLSIPGTPQYHLILTAAHNLVAADSGERVTDLKVIFSNPDIDPVPVNNTKENVYICEDYQQGVADGDYGSIRIPYKGIVRGFGFSMKLAYEAHFKGTVYVSGCRAKRICMSKTSTGHCVICYPKVVEYSCRTEEGISGSPVWIEHKGSQFVVAIQYVPPCH
jgi:V8-like Glu-specific endopeptidase